MLPEGSFFNDFPILFNHVNVHNIYASNISTTRTGTLLLGIKRKKFKKYCREFPEVEYLLKKRAIIRRSYFRMIEVEL